MRTSSRASAVARWSQTPTSREKTFQRDCGRRDHRAYELSRRAPHRRSPQESTLRGCDLCGVELTGANLHHLAPLSCDLSGRADGPDLRGESDRDESVLAGAALTDADLTIASVINTDLWGRVSRRRR